MAHSRRLAVSAALLLRRQFSGLPYGEAGNGQFSVDPESGAPQTTKMGTQIIGEFLCRGREAALQNQVKGRDWPKAERLLLASNTQKADILPAGG